MIILIVLGTAVTIVLALLGAKFARNTPRRENRLAYSETFGAAPWIDGGGGSSDCDAGTSGDAGGDVGGGDAGCGDGGGGGGGGD
jgi:hypothetical protein